MYIASNTCNISTYSFSLYNLSLICCLQKNVSVKYFHLRFCCNSGSHRSPFANSFSLLYSNSSCVSVAYSKLGVSTMAPTGHALSQNPQKMHLVKSISYRVVLLLPSALSSASIVIARAGHDNSHSLHAIHLSSPDG